MKSKRSFTLIELMLVISVIAILSGILLPALAKVRETVRTTMCISNEKQLLVGDYTYSADFDGIAPDPTNDPAASWRPTQYYMPNLGNNRTKTFFYSVMVEQGKYYSPKVMRCPAYVDALGATRMDLENIFSIAGKNYAMSYGLAPFESIARYVQAPLRLGKYPSRALHLDTLYRGGNGTYNPLPMHNIRSKVSKDADGLPAINEYMALRGTGRLVHGDVVAGYQDGGVNAIYNVVPWYNYANYYGAFTTSFNRDNTKRYVGTIGITYY